MDKEVRITRKKAQGMDELIGEFISDMKIASGLNTRLIFNAWDKASGAAQYTTRRFFRDGSLYITLSSSVVRNQLSFQKILLVEKINQILLNDGLFVKDDPRTGYVKRLILK